MPLRAFRPDAPEGFERVLLKAMQKQPAQPLEIGPGHGRRAAAVLGLDVLTLTSWSPGFSRSFPPKGGTPTHRSTVDSPPTVSRIVEKNLVRGAANVVYSGRDEATWDD